MNQTIDNAIQDLESELDAIIAGVNNPSAPAPLPTISDEEAESILEQKQAALDAEIMAELESELAAEAPAAIPETVTLQTFGPGEAQEAPEPIPVSKSPEALEASPAPAVAESQRVPTYNPVDMRDCANGLHNVPEDGEGKCTVCGHAEEEPETYGTYAAVIGADVRCYLEIHGISARTREEARKLAHDMVVNSNAECQAWKPEDLQGEITIAIGDEETDGAEWDEFEPMPDPHGTPRYQTLESFVRNIAEMTSLRDIWEGLPEGEREESPDDMDVSGDQAFADMALLNELIAEARKLFPNAAPKRKPASLGAAAAPVEPEPAADLKPYSVIVGWSDDIEEHGTYGWAGLAADDDDAERKAREAGSDGGGSYEPEGEVLFRMEGVDVWTAPDLLASLKEVTDWMRENVRPGESPEAHAMLVKAMAVIAKAECREGVA
jgi:hypothetical protein